MAPKRQFFRSLGLLLACLLLLTGCGEKKEMIADVNGVGTDSARQFEVKGGTYEMNASLYPAGCMHRSTLVQLGRFPTYYVVQIGSHDFEQPPFRQDLAPGSYTFSIKANYTCHWEYRVSQITTG